MNTNEVIFERRKLAASCIVSKKLERDNEAMAMITGNLDYRLTGVVYESAQPVQKKTFTFKAPTFLEWLLRKPRVVEVTVRISDLLANPPPSQIPTLRIMTLDDAKDWKE